MSLLEKALSFIAPHDCLRCGAEGSLICAGCWSEWLQPLPSRCYKCHKLTENHKVCPSCFHKTALRAIYVRGQYDEAAKQLVYKLKFERAQAAAATIATYIDEVLPPHFTGVIVPVPTASSRRRQRGYDQAVLIAKHLSRERNLELVKALRRHGQSRQVGSKRQDRLKQLTGAFDVIHPERVQGQTVLLVDDVLTTGATLETAARLLKAASVRRVEAIVLAQA